MKKKHNEFNAFKMELASDISADIKDYPNGDAVTSRGYGAEGARVARKIIEDIENESRPDFQ